MDWKAPPADPDKKWVNRSLEIQILLACNWDCHACDQFSQFSKIAWIKKGTMSAEQIDHFIDEMVKTNSYIGRIRLVGGEPSLHPKLPQIIRMLHNCLVNTGHVGRLEMVTNGSNDAKIIAAKKQGTDQEVIPLRVRRSDENDKQKSHTANLVATPEMLGYEGRMCSAPWHCGISLNYYGYFPCSSGAGIARLIDNMAQWQRMTLPVGDVAPFNSKKVATVMRTWPDLQQLCNKCYHGLRDEDKIKCGTGSKPGQAGLNKPSPSINAHLQPWLEGKQPDWKVYGATPV